MIHMVAQHIFGSAILKGGVCLARQQKNQTYILKINSGYLSKHNWSLSLKLNEIRKHSQMVVSLGSSQVLRWLEEEPERKNNDAKATEIKNKIKELKREENTYENKTSIREKYDELYYLQFQQDYMMLVMDSVSDYRYVCNHGFKITIDYGIKGLKTVTYRRFLGTAGSIKKSTIMFVNEDKYDFLMNRINNGRYQGPINGEEEKTYNGKVLKYKFIPAKLNAYFALQCSASICVGSFTDDERKFPKFIVVDDAISKFNAKVRMVHDDGYSEEHPDWPYADKVEEKEIEYNVSDGMGFITPELSAKWAGYLGEGNEPISGFNTRCSFLKGMVFTIPFKEFAEEVAHSYEIMDAWGDKRDIRDADLILTTSMLKLWDSYAGMEDYIENCRKNHYEFCIAKSAPHELRNVHTTNYQYLQDFKFSDEQINELISPTVDKIKECLGLDWKKLILYMCGTGLDEKNFESMEPMCKAIMANPDIINDPYVRSKVSRMIQKRINSAKIGVLDVEGDYAILGNDPYFLLQTIFGLNVEEKGLLKAGECYHKYWIDKNVDEVVVFRAPMTSHENVCKLRVVSNSEMEKWYRYVKTCCFINAYDTTAIRLNGADYDSDTVFSTNNKVLLEAFEYKDTLMCDQSSMPKIAPEEKDYIASDINGFGDTIGSVTNKATNMISLRASFEENSEEYKILTDRIDTMMNFQQNAIDRIKGVVARPVPNEWLEKRLHKAKSGDSEDILRKKEINYNVAAEIKPWFFIYRYSKLKTQLDKYNKSVRSNCKIRFGQTLEDLYKKENKTDDEKTFLEYYELYMPVSRAPGMMNKICWRIEEEFETTNVLPNVNFDRSILKNNAVYTEEEYNSIKQVYEDYGKALLLVSKGREKNELSGEDVEADVFQLKEAFMDTCYSICPNRNVLSNILIDVCYTTNKNKSFAWEIAGDVIYENVLKNSGNIVQIPVKNDDGDIDFCGEKFSILRKEVGGNHDSE